MNITDYLTLSQAAEALGYASTGYLRQRCLNGEIPGVQKMGRNWLIPRLWVQEQQDKIPTGQGARGQSRK